MCDEIIRTDLAGADKKQELFNLPINYQIHRHTKTCQNFKNKNCRLHYGRFFTDDTIIAEPLISNISANVKEGFMGKRNEVLGKVKEYIDTNLNPLTKTLLRSIPRFL